MHLSYSYATMGRRPSAAVYIALLERDVVASEMHSPRTLCILRLGYVPDNDIYVGVVK